MNILLLGYFSGNIKSVKTLKQYKDGKKVSLTMRVGRCPILDQKLADILTHLLGVKEH